uniref:Uncharacterized protein n=1 Tax=Candidatus Kentrum sp. TC TaxID=2126339 RepID=A0A451A7T6_9GAMM|nr:MAG: hypothetical protein BECKTC1821F_GA0114240_10694 [Candidatus Kentron sp. TC]
MPLASPDRQFVGARASMRGVVATTTVQVVEAIAAIKRAVSRAPVDGVISGATDHCVVAKSSITRGSGNKAVLGCGSVV